MIDTLQRTFLGFLAKIKIYTLQQHGIGIQCRVKKSNAHFIRVYRVECAISDLASCVFISLAMVVGLYELYLRNVDVNGTVFSSLG